MQASQQTKINQDVAVALERVIGRLESLEGWRKDIDDERRRQDERRDERIEKAPEGVRSAFSTYGGCIGQIIFAVLSGLGVLISIAALIITLTR